MKKNNPPEDYKLFLTSQEAPLNDFNSQSLIKIKNDLVKSPWRLAGWYLGFSLLGYLVSLLVCAQNSLGLSGFAYDMAQAIHRLPDPWCPMICGAVFTAVPFVLTTAFLNRFQHRYLIFKMWWFFALIPCLGTLSMIWLPANFQHQRLTQHMHDLAQRNHGLSQTEWMVVWALSAIVFPYLCEWVVWGFVSPKKRSLHKTTEV
jgi:hypothetical protein